MSDVAALTFSGVTKTYAGRRRSDPPVVAVDDVSFDIAPGAAVGLVGASGSGKSTIAKIITGQERPTSGQVHFGDVDVAKLGQRGLRDYHRRVQMVFQDPYGALNPLHTVGYTLTRPLRNFRGMSAAEADTEVGTLLETVGLTPYSQFVGKLPHQLSGGQRQRVVIARALSVDPELIVADEPVSMLDVSMRAGVLRLLSQLRESRGISLLYITHDLLSARVATDDLLVLHNGRIVEHGPTKDVLQHPQDDYTVALLDALATPGRPATPASA
ncbi:ABC transporter ATP-binding protein [Rudaeicoccus suwonensis]|uniref:ABC transporter family protein n=1 Tax=Rudaeicoccus suwonensis TaxID=657409 RepID=A0A561E7Y1_9MICO|nr:ABC transporter family protein [Rudaeicoccus suwonensis]